MEGYLLKWTNYVFGWQRRYFILYNGVLHYCKEKGSAQRGAIHLDISTVSKHPGNPKRFSISTGCTHVYLKAYTQNEAVEWLNAFKQEQLDLKFSNTPMDPSTVSSIILDKVAAMWGIHSQLLSSIDQIPISAVKNNKNLENIIKLLDEMKTVSANALGIIEHEREHASKISPLINRFSCEGAPFEDDEFEDALSQIDQVPIRKCLPVLRVPRSKKNIWKKIEETIGNEFPKVQVPIAFNEPISLLQRLSEDLKFCSLLIQADTCKEIDKRIALITSFVCSCYLPPFRVTKPFNSYIGETFELEINDFKLVAEQVALNVSAIYCEHPSFKFWNTTEIGSQFVENRLEINPIGACYVELSSTGEKFTWSRPSTVINNLVAGKISVVHQGDIRITNFANQCFSEVKFDANGAFAKVFDSNSKETYSVICKDEILISKNGEKNTVLDKQTFPDGHEHCYYFSLFTLQLNLPEYIYEGLPSTDSRHRKDIRALENGEISKCLVESSKIFNEKSKNSQKWFSYENGQWKYNGKYWEARHKDSQ